MLGLLRYFIIAFACLFRCECGNQADLELQGSLNIPPPHIAAPSHLTPSGSQWSAGAG